jgi:hypothetical protein
VGIQWTLNYNPAFFTQVTVSEGAAAFSAGKSLSCASLMAGSTTCLLAGMNTNLLPDGIAAAVAVTVAQNVSGAATIGIAGTQAASSDGGSAALTGTDGTVTVIPVQLSSLTCNPQTITTPGSSTCTLFLNRAVTLDTVVALSSDNAALTVPVNVTVAAGNNSATFTATATSNPAQQSATVTASLNGSTQPAVLTLVAPVSITSLGCAPVILGPNQGATCSVSASQPAPPNGWTVALGADNAIVTVPAGITILQGATSASFTVAVGNFTSDQSAALTATLSGSTRQFNLSLVNSIVVLTSLVCSASNLGLKANDLCSVTLNKAAPTGGVVVSLSSTNPLLLAPDHAFVSSGNTSANFPVSTGSFSTDQLAPLTGAVNGLSQTVSLSLNASIALTSLTCIPPILLPKTYGTCTLLLDRAVPAGGLAVSVSSSALALMVPFSVVVPGGSSSTSFKAEAQNLQNDQSVTVTVALVPGAKSFAISLMLATTQTGQLQSTAIGLSESREYDTPVLNSLDCTAAVPAGGWFDCAAAFTGVSSASRLHVSSAGAGLKVPEFLAVRSGETRACFRVFAERDSSGMAEIAVYSGSDYRSASVAIANALPLGVPLRNEELLPAAGSTVLVSVGGSGWGQGWITVDDVGLLAAPRTWQNPGAPARPGDRITIYARGLPTGASPLVDIGGVLVQPDSLQSVPESPGITGIVVRIPAYLVPSDSVPVALLLDLGARTNTVTFAVENR